MGRPREPLASVPVPVTSHNKPQVTVRFCQGWGHTMVCASLENSWQTAEGRPQRLYNGELHVIVAQEEKKKEKAVCSFAAKELAWCRIAGLPTLVLKKPFRGLQKARAYCVSLSARYNTIHNRCDCCDLHSAKSVLVPEALTSSLKSHLRGSTSLSFMFSGRPPTL